MKQKNVSVRVQLVREATKRKGPKVRNPEDVAKLLDDLRQKDREHLICIHLNAKNEVLSRETVSVGSLNGSVVAPRECFKAAILANAHSVIIGHNHPSGDPEPSNEDKTITGILKKAGELLGIELVDHIIIGGDSFFSFKEKGFL